MRVALVLFMGALFYWMIHNPVADREPIARAPASIGPVVLHATKVPAPLVITPIISELPESLPTTLKNYLADVKGKDPSLALPIRAAYLGRLFLTPEDVVREITHLLEQMPKDGQAEEKLQLLELAAGLLGQDDQVANIALQLLDGTLHSMDRSESASVFEKYQFPMGAVEIYLTRKRDDPGAVLGIVAAIQNQANPATRRLMAKYVFKAKPELQPDLQEELRAKISDML
ncbi:hypothetical protein WDW37_08270 [Bdellovibrionota bacterium FG-1]